MFAKISLMMVMIVGVAFFSANASATENASAAEWDAEWGSTEEAEDRYFKEWDSGSDYREERALETPLHSTAAVMGVQTAGVCVTSIGLGALTLPIYMMLYLSVMGNGLPPEVPLLLLGGVALSSPFLYALSVNEIGKRMGRGSHYGWSLAGAALGSVATIGLSMAVSMANIEMLEFAMLPISLLPLVGVIGGYHFGYQRSLQQSTPGLTLQPVRGLPEWGSPARIEGATLNLGISF